jgi:hypothetical protein
VIYFFDLLVCMYVKEREKTGPTTKNKTEATERSKKTAPVIYFFHTFL